MREIIFDDHTETILSIINLSYLKTPPRELLFRIARNISIKDGVSNNSSVIKKPNLLTQNDNTRSY